jgi:hypothetical protein
MSILAGKDCLVDISILLCGIQLAPVYFMWMVWREMNNCSFDGVEKTIFEIKSDFV